MEVESMAVASSAWCRRLKDGRTLMLVVADKDLLPEGVNDAVVRVGITTGELRDETEAGKGKEITEILHGGWKSVQPKSISLAEAIAMLF